MTEVWANRVKGRITDFIDGDETALPDLYCCFAGRDRELTTEAADALTARVDGMSPSQLVSFLNRMGEYTSMDWYDSWRDRSPSEQFGFLDSHSYFTVAAVGTAHPNGYYREACVKVVAHFGGAALPFLLLRVNDWVGKVQQLAMTLSEKILRQCPPEDVLAALPYLYRLGRCYRRDEADYALLMRLTTERLTAAQELLTPQRVRRLDRDGRRLCYSIAMQEGIYTTDRWVTLLRIEKDPFTRRYAARAMLEDDRWEEYSKLLLSHRDSGLRLLAVQTLWERLGTSWDGYEQLLCDPRQSVREWARYAVRQQTPSIDFAAYNRQRLEEAESAGAVAGLGETGTQADSARIKLILQSDSAQLRKAALTALGRISAESERETYYQFLLDGGGTAKIAFLLLRDGHMYLSCEQLYHDLQRVEDIVTKRRLCTLLGMGAAWDSLPWLLELWDYPDEPIALLARYFLNGWQFGYQRPRAEELEHCRQALDARRAELPAKLLHRLEFELAHV